MSVVKLFSQNAEPKNAFRGKNARGRKLADVEEDIDIESQLLDDSTDIAGIPTDRTFTQFVKRTPDLRKILDDNSFKNDYEAVPYDLQEVMLDIFSRGDQFVNIKQSLQSRITFQKLRSNKNLLALLLENPDTGNNQTLLDTLNRTPKRFRKIVAADLKKLEDIESFIAEEEQLNDVAEISQPSSIQNIEEAKALVLKVLGDREPGEEDDRVYEQMFKQNPALTSFVAAAFHARKYEDNIPRSMIISEERMKKTLTSEALRNTAARKKLEDEIVDLARQIEHQMDTDKKRLGTLNTSLWSYIFIEFCLVFAGSFKLFRDQIKDEIPPEFVIPVSIAVATGLSLMGSYVAADVAARVRGLKGYLLAFMAYVAGTGAFVMAFKGMLLRMMPGLEGWLDGISKGNGIMNMDLGQAGIFIALAAVIVTVPTVLTTAAVGAKIEIKKIQDNLAERINESVKRDNLAPEEIDTDIETIRANARKKMILAKRETNTSFIAAGIAVIISALATMHLTNMAGLAAITLGAVVPTILIWRFIKNDKNFEETIEQINDKYQSNKKDARSKEEKDRAMELEKEEVLQTKRVSDFGKIIVIGFSISAAVFSVWGIMNGEENPMAQLTNLAKTILAVGSASIGFFFYRAGIMTYRNALDETNVHEKIEISESDRPDDQIRDLRDKMAKARNRHHEFSATAAVARTADIMETAAQVLAPAENFMANFDEAYKQVRRQATDVDRLAESRLLRRLATFNKAHRAIQTSTVERDGWEDMPPMPPMMAGGYYPVYPPQAPQKRGLFGGGQMQQPAYPYQGPRAPM